jgi:hypothetical protein
LATQLKDYYYTFIDVMVWRDAACELLDQCGRMFFELSFDSNHELCTQFLDLLVAVVQMHFLVQRVPDRRI